MAREAFVRGGWHAIGHPREHQVPEKRKHFETHPQVCRHTRANFDLLIIYFHCHNLINAKRPCVIS